MNLIKYFKNIVYLFVFIGYSAASAGSYEDFFLALDRNDPGSVTRLLERGFDPNTRDPQGRPGLFVALQKESFDAAQALFRHPQIDVNALNNNDESPLMMAAMKGQVQWCMQLLDKGAVVNKTGWTPLHYAASGSEHQVVALLLDKGAAIDAPSPNGSTPIMMAALYGSEASVNLLVTRGADLKRKNDLGLTVSDFAARGGRDKLAAQLKTSAGS
ncbi:MAG: ankyrin repeat domain-containing protein [Rhizobacter sp.]